VERQLQAMKANGCTRLLVLPAYPQYCAATTASVYDMVFDWGLKTRTLPELRFVNHYHDEPTYIEALRASVQKHWMAHGRPDKLVMSFHGMPDRTLHLGDPYHCECHKTGRLLAEALGLQKDDYKVTFQSRFGRAKWLEPYTEPSLVAMAREGVGRVDVICPGFSSDCIETLEEIDQEAREAFLHAGGKAFHYIPCLNDSAEGMRALTAVCEQHLSGWPTRVAPAADELQRARAVGMGASL
jgi:ferrochelatase